MGSNLGDICPTVVQLCSASAVHANGNELKGMDGVDVPNQQDITDDYNILEGISSEGQSASCNDDSPISQSDTQQTEEGSEAKQSNALLDEKNVVKNVETHLIREGENKVNHTDLDTEKEGKAIGHVEKNANLRSTSNASHGAVNQACNSVQENPLPLDKNGANIEQVARAQDESDEPPNDATGDGKEKPEGDDQNDKLPPVEQPTGDTPTSDHAEKIKNRLLKEGRELKETTSMIDNAVYNVEQMILKTKFYTTAIRNFVHFKVHHICEYSKCGPNARCYIVEKDKEECRCIANYMPDNSVDYFKCIPKTVKDCSKDNGNCDVNAECSTDKKENIKCQCKHGYIGDGIFCVMGSQGKQSLCLLLVLLICFLHKFLF
ncbi:surface protein 10 [Plasmodium coatneyi]|uniref:Surface protein 10 n=1 Tax=Plasmodium coatneyi TaxID=208452 RepID=A0A1B1E2I8_9APIC|nr:surface protein 10 [Plasmodium coatneyi]ANQ09157.1 surface protein 10 [Plasmodium coatneyi]